MTTLKTKWIEALRSGKYRQTREILKDGKGYCCLGVLCDVTQPDRWVGDNYDNLSNYPPNWVIEKAGIPKHHVQMYAHLNDDYGYSFADIAAVVELGNIDEVYERERTKGEPDED